MAMNCALTQSLLLVDHNNNYIKCIYDCGINIDAKLKRNIFNYT